MENQEKIFELLDKQNLTENEQKLLMQYSEKDAEIKSFINIYNKLKSSISLGGHIPAELLASYILYEEENDSGDKIMQILSGRIKTHLADCAECKNVFNDLRTEYSLIDEHVSKSVTQKSESGKSISINNSIFKRTSFFKYAVAAMIVIVVSYIGLFFVSSSITPDYKRNIFKNESEDSYLTRGRTSQLFQQGLNAIDEKNYSKAIEFLSQDIDEHKNEKSIFYSHYVLGLTYLRASESDFLGLFNSYNIENVNLAITNFNESIEKNNSGNYESLKLNTYYYLGRAYLLIDDSNSAISNFQKVIEGNGSFAPEAAKLISELEKN